MNLCLITPEYLLLSPSTASSCFSFQEEAEEEEHSSTILPALCFDDGRSINFDDITLDYGKFDDTMATHEGSLIMATHEGSLIMPDYDYLWDYGSWHPSVEDSTPCIAHDDDEEMASLHHMWQSWLDVTDHLYPFDQSSLNNGLPNSSISSCMAMSPAGNGSSSFTSDTPAAHSGGFTSTLATDNMYMQSSLYSAAPSSAIVASPPQLDLEDCNNALETTAKLVENTEVVAFQVKCDTPALHDGYLWRKYGQKNIKGKRFPRSYYRCAHPGCSIKKQIESSSEMEGYVVMTYIGKHIH